MTIKDNKGNTPNFVVVGNKLIHQPTGIDTHLPSTSKYAMKVAMRKLMLKIDEKQNADS